MFFVNFDFAISLQKSFQDPATPLMEGIIDLHHHICFFLIVVICLVVWILISIVDHFHFHRYFIHSSNNLSMILFLNRFEKTKSFTHHSLLEIIWTIIPSLILVLIAIPSFTLLYSIDEIINPEITFKVIGHQWYWSYEFDDFNNSEDFYDYEFDSYMVPTDYLEEDGLNLRLLEVDAPLYLPLRTHIRVIVTSSDVLHAWAVPSLGVKIDAVPGRLNQISLFIKRAGTFYGQCSEICGVNHGFMPIVIHAVPQDIFQKLIS